MVEIKKFKCKLCKKKYVLMSDLFYSVSHDEGIYGVRYYRAFNCPYCNELYILGYREITKKPYFYTTEGHKKYTKLN